MKLTNDLQHYVDFIYTKFHPSSVKKYWKYKQKLIYALKYKHVSNKSDKERSNIHFRPTALYP